MNRPSASDAFLTATDIVKTFDYRPVLRGLHLSLARNECVALTGANGSGKSTLLRIMAGLAVPDHGRIGIQGASLTDAGPRARADIGYLGHNPALHHGLSVWHHLEFAARLHGLVQASARAEMLMRSAGLAGVKRTPTGELSRGMQQKVALCRTWLPDPRILLLDEPDSHLDAQGLDFLHALLSQRRRADQTILFTSHRADHASQWADRTVRLLRGRIQEETADRTGRGV